jgi:hypothetical protein
VSVQDILATVVTLALALAAPDGRRAPRADPQQLSRKLIHIGTGPLFVFCWNLFTPAPEARWLAALVALSITAQFVLVGLGIIKDPAAVKAMSRSGDPREILRGPLYYGIVFIAHAGVLARVAGGRRGADADAAATGWPTGRRLGQAKLPWSGQVLGRQCAMLVAVSCLARVGDVDDALGASAPSTRRKRPTRSRSSRSSPRQSSPSCAGHRQHHRHAGGDRHGLVLIVPLGMWAVPFWG